MHPIKIRIERVKDHSFTILQSSEGHVVLNINHYSNKAKFGNVYVSDYSGVYYSLSLIHNVRDSNGFCDFDKINGLFTFFLNI